MVVVVLVSYVAIDIIIPGFWRPEPIKINSKVKLNMHEMQVAADAFKDQSGEYPQDQQQIDSMLKQHLIDPKDFEGHPMTMSNPANSESSWVVVIPIARKEELLEKVKTARPGQVVYCPIIDNGKVRDFCITGIRSDGSLASGPNQRPMVITGEPDYTGK
jgi:hypothetical protein